MLRPAAVPSLSIRSRRRRLLLDQHVQSELRCDELSGRGVVPVTEKCSDKCFSKRVQNEILAVTDVFRTVCQQTCSEGMVPATDVFITVSSDHVSRRHGAGHSRVQKDVQNGVAPVTNVSSQSSGVWWRLSLRAEPSGARGPACARRVPRDSAIAVVKT